MLLYAKNKTFRINYYNLINSNSSKGISISLFLIFRQTNKHTVHIKMQIIHVSVIVEY